MSEEPSGVPQVIHSSVAALLAKDPKLHAIARVVAAFRVLNAELPMQQAAILLAVAMRPGIVAAELEDVMSLSQSSVSRGIHALSAVHPKGVPGLGLVESLTDPQDGRRACLYLTEKGLNFVRHLLLSGLLDGSVAGQWPGPVYAATRRLRGVQRVVE